MSLFASLRRFSLALLIAGIPGVAVAQQPPRTTQGANAQVRDLQQMLQASGLSIDQIRTRLRAQGLSENLLDSYYSGRSPVAPDSNIFAAVRALGISDIADSTLRASAPGSSNTALATITALNARDSAAAAKAFVDSVAAIVLDDTTRVAVLDMLRSRDLRRAQMDSGFALFGSAVFQRGSTLFDPNNVGPAPPDYRLGPGDELVLILTGDTERLHELPITREGMVFIPNVGGISVANLTMRQLEDVLWTRLGRVYSGIRRGNDATAHFQVTVSKLGSVQVSVLGDVVKPGAYRVSKIGTLLTALYAAGGPSDGGSVRRVEVRRAGRLVATLDLYDYLISGNSTSDVRLESGDIVLVPPRGARARVAGAVVRPATYELRPNETLGDLIRMAGGFRPEADRRRVQVRRVVPPEQRTASGADRTLFDVASAALETSREAIISGDVVIVSTIAGKVANQVTVAGNVWSPGPVALTPGMRVSQALARAGGIQPDTYIDALQISRLEPDSTRTMVRIRVPGEGNNGQASDDLVLRPDDEIRVFSQAEYRPARYVTINGAVGRPGKHPFSEGMTLRDVLMLAGGMQEGALLTEAEVARMPSDRREGATAVTMRVPLDSSYLFDRRPGTEYLGPPGLAAPTAVAQEFELKAYDNVLVLRQPDFLLPRIVHLRGEVQYPGDYALKSKGERLLDLVDRAGGLTRDAYPRGIEFYRAQNDVGRIGLDLPAAIRNRSHPDNLLLADGDSIRIPFYSAVVTVTGAVNAPVTVPFVSGRNIDYYVYAAGGPSQLGEAKKSYVMQPGGKLESRRSRRFMFDSKPSPQPGSVVAVPARVETEGVNVAATLTAITSILSSGLALIAIITSNR